MQAPEPVIVDFNGMYFLLAKEVVMNCMDQEKAAAESMRHGITNGVIPGANIVLLSQPSLDPLEAERLISNDPGAEQPLYHHQEYPRH